MVDVREHFTSSYPRTKYEVIEEWIERAKWLISIEQSLSRPLTAGEKQTLCWLATYETF